MSPRSVKDFLVQLVSKPGLPVMVDTLGGLTSTHNKRGCAILTKKVVPKNPATYLKLRLKNPEPETPGFPST